MTQAEPAITDKIRRTRASESALKKTLTAMREAGLSVDKVCVTGGKVEIHCAPIAGKPAAKKDGGLREW
jgi:hypothetical protein